MFVDSKLLAGNKGGNTSNDNGEPCAYLSLREMILRLSPAAKRKYNMCLPIEINIKDRVIRVGFVDNSSESHRVRGAIGCSSIFTALELSEGLGTLILKIEKVEDGFLYLQPIPEQCDISKSPMYSLNKQNKSQKRKKRSSSK